MDDNSPLDILKNMAYNHEDALAQVQLKSFMEFRQLYEAAIRLVSTKIENLQDEFKLRFDYRPIHHFEVRNKEPDSIVAKLNQRGLEVSMASAMKHLEDIAGVRIVCPYVDDVYMVTELLLSQEDIRLVHLNDYIKKPKDNGYRSVHIVLEVPVYLAIGKKYVKVEVQLRTIAMDFWASLEHDIRYKRLENSNREDLLLRLKVVAQKIHMLDREMLKIFQDSRTINENE